MRRPAPVLQWLLALAAPAAATGIGLLLDGHMSVAGLSMAYLLAVVAVSMALDRAPALAASALCVSALDFWFVPPRLSFAVHGAEYWWTLTVLLGLSLGLNSLIVALRAGRERAREGESRAGQLRQLAEALADRRGEDAMARAAADWLHGALGHPAAVLVRDGPGSALRCHASGAPAGAFDSRAAAWTMDHGRPLGAGTTDWPDLPLWCAPFPGRPALGAVQCLLSGGLSAREARDTGPHREALARQVGLAVDRERAALAAQQASQRAHAESARNTLLASLSHDLRTPLAAIVGSASTLRAQAAALPAGERERLLANLEDEARDLTLMADNVLQWARLSQPHVAPRLQWESLEEILGVAMQRWRRRWPRARLELKVAAGLPPLRAEAALLAQLATNLVDNALRHGGDAAAVTVQAGRSRLGVFIAVRDRGHGLPPGDPQALFDRWDTRGQEGTAGLGLAICRLIAQVHGGSIEARRCEPGTEVRVDLPATEPERDDG